MKEVENLPSRLHALVDVSDVLRFEFVLFFDLFSKNKQNKD